MDAAGIDVQVLSLTSPGVKQLDAPEAVAFARETNDLLADAVVALKSPVTGAGYRDARGEPLVQSGNWGRRGDQDGGIRARA